MAGWRFLLGPMLTWAAHFFIGYAASVTIYGTDAIRPLLIVLTIGCLATNAWIFAAARRRLTGADAFNRWIAGASLALLLLSTVGIIFQAFTLMLT